jgi:integrase/recombinase XerC
MDFRETRAGVLLNGNVAYLDHESAVYQAMLTGFRNRMMSQNLKQATIKERVRRIELFRASCEFRYPWQWSSPLFEEFIAALVERGRSLGTIRGYQGDINLFVMYVRDPAYGWQEQCYSRFGAYCDQVSHEGNMVRHASEIEASPERRALSYDELQILFDKSDSKFQKLLNSKKKGSLATLRNRAIVAACYAWGIRRNGARMLDLKDFHHNPKAPEFGNYGVLHVRFGKSGRGGAPKQYWVLTVPEVEWAVSIVRQYVEQIRPHYAASKKTSAVFLTERGGRLSRESMDYAFRELRDEAELPNDLTLHCVRHSFMTHLTEWGYDRVFVQQQLGHAHPSTSSIYEHVSADYKNLQIRNSIERTISRGLAKFALAASR